MDLRQNKNVLKETAVKILNDRIMIAVSQLRYDRNCHSVVQHILSFTLTWLVTQGLHQRDLLAPQFPLTRRPQWTAQHVQACTGRTVSAKHLLCNSREGSVEQQRVPLQTLGKKEQVVELIRTQ